jgi:hypothetical protein
MWNTEENISREIDESLTAGISNLKRRDADGKLSLVR